MPAPTMQQALAMLLRQTAELGGKMVVAAVDVALGEAQELVGEADRRIRKARRRARSIANHRERDE